MERDDPIYWVKYCEGVQDSAKREEIQVAATAAARSPLAADRR
jgi:hypothetical protein